MNVRAILGGVFGGTLQLERDERAPLSTTIASLGSSTRLESSKKDGGIRTPYNIASAGGKCLVLLNVHRFHSDRDSHHSCFLACSWFSSAAL